MQNFGQAFKAGQFILPQLNVIRFGESVDGVVDGSAGGQADVDVHQLVRPLLDNQLEAIVASGRGRTSGNDQSLQIPGGKADQAGLGDVLAAADVQQPEAGGLLQDPLDLRVVHAVEVAAAVDGDVKLSEVRESGRVDLLLDRRVGEAEHGVVGVQDLQLLAALLELLDVDEDGVSGGRGDVGDVQHFQV